MWEVDTGTCLFTIFHDGRVYAVTFSADGNSIVTGDFMSNIKVSCAKTGHIQRKLVGCTDAIASVAVRDGRVAAGSKDKITRLWDQELMSEKAVQEFVGHTNFVLFVAFSNDSKQLVTTSLDSTARLWDIESGQCVQIFHGHKGAVFFALFWNNDFLITGSGDESVKLWSLETGSCLRTFRGHVGAVVNASLIRDQTQMLTLSLDNSIHCWHLPLLSSSCFTWATMWHLSDNGRATIADNVAPSIAASDDLLLTVQFLTRPGADVLVSRNIIFTFVFGGIFSKTLRALHHASHRKDQDDPSTTTFTTWKRLLAFASDSQNMVGLTHAERTMFKTRLMSISRNL